MRAKKCNLRYFYPNDSLFRGNKQEMGDIGASKIDVAAQTHQRQQIVFSAVHTHSALYVAHTYTLSRHVLINTWFSHGLGVLSSICRCLPQLNDLSVFRLCHSRLVMQQFNTNQSLTLFFFCISCLCVCFQYFVSVFFFFKKNRLRVN